jgi:hypothetical protein
MRRLLAPLALVVLLGAFAVPTVHAKGVHAASPGTTAVCTPANLVLPQDEVITGSGYKAGDFYTVRFAQAGAPYGAAETLADANGDISVSMTATGLETFIPPGQTDVTVNDQPGSKLRVLATCSFTAS